MARVSKPPIEVHLPQAAALADQRRQPQRLPRDRQAGLIVHALGGWYFAVGVRCAAGIHLPPTVDLFAVRDLNRYTGTAWACDNGVFFAKAGHPVLRRAIDQVVEHCRSRYDGV